MTSGSHPFRRRVVVVGGVILALVFALLVASAIWGVTMNHHNTEVAATPTVVDGDFTVRISDFEFVPSNLSVPAGASVTWGNEDEAPHDATDDDDAWQTKTLDEDQSGAVTFDDAGTFTYHCSIHPYMKAKVIVRER
jgi:plastocyanin